MCEGLRNDWFAESVVGHDHGRRNHIDFEACLQDIRGRAENSIQHVDRVCSNEKEVAKENERDLSHEDMAWNPFHKVSVSCTRARSDKRHVFVG